MLGKKAVAVGVATVIMAWVVAAIITPLLLMTIGMLAKTGEEGQQKIHQAGTIAQELVRVNIWGQAVYSRATLTAGNNTVTTVTPDLRLTPTIMTFTNSWGGDSVIDYIQVVGWNDEILTEKSFDRGEFRIRAGQVVTATPDFLGLGSDYKFFQEFKARVSSVRLHTVHGNLFGSGYGAPSTVGDVAEVRQQVVETIVRDQETKTVTVMVTERIERTMLPDGTIHTKFPDGRMEVEFPNGFNIRISGETTNVATKTAATQTSISVKGWSPDENTARDDVGSSRSTSTSSSVTSHSWLPAEGDLRCRDLNDNGRQDPEEMFASNCYIVRAFEPKRSDTDTNPESGTDVAQTNDSQRRRDSSGSYDDWGETSDIHIRDYVFLSLNDSVTGFVYIFLLSLSLLYRAFQRAGGLFQKT